MIGREHRAFSPLGRHERTGSKSLNPQITQMDADSDSNRGELGQVTARLTSYRCTSQLVLYRKSIQIRPFGTAPEGRPLRFLPPGSTSSELEYPLDAKGEVEAFGVGAQHQPARALLVRIGYGQNELVTRGREPQPGQPHVALAQVAGIG